MGSMASMTAGLMTDKEMLCNIADALEHHAAQLSIFAAQLREGRMLGDEVINVSKLVMCAEAIEAEHMRLSAMDGYSTRRR